MTLNLNQMDGDDVSELYKGIKSEYLPNVNVNRDNVLTTGLFRSVIARNGKVLSFAPPKSMETSHFIQTYDASECDVEEFVEGTMINMFYDDNYQYTNTEKSKWIICTKSNIGAKNSFFTNGHINPEDTFYNMFLDACNHAKLDFDTLDKSYQYSFVLQHPRNRIVLDIKEPTLYLISVNKISDDNIVTRVFERQELFKHTNVKFPKSYNYECKDLREFEKEWENIDGKNLHDYREMGLVVVHRITGNRTKFRNPHYEYVKVLRGNQPKLEYRFIELWQEKRVEEYLSYFPECKTLFNEYWSKLSKFMDTAFNNYVACYMLKRQALKEYPFEYRNHMYELHAIYKEKLRCQSKVVTIPIAVEYFRTLPTAKIMFSLNYNMRPKDTPSEAHHL